eukprot:TRINITY_DN8531_c0_g3_i1.p2 TRINITY_DN8531_c0_g3~~TRINITY_DN8531_c0_g3_i1.p2  ORF type:complete len:258 (-),score=67.48 TRINITY_DN8531_c0_g3_i1:165-938(-)
MAIIYSLVARGPTVLAEFTTTSGNFTTVTRRILDKIPSNDAKMSYAYDRHVFHYVVEDGIVYMCMADEAFARRVAFAFLDDARSAFRSAYGGAAQTALAYGMNEDFSRTLERRMEYYNTSPDADRITAVRGQIDEVKSVMVQNIEKVLERGEKIELLVDKTENLNAQAFQFKKKATNLKRAMWWKNMKLSLLIGLIVCLVIFIIVWIACGADFGKCKSKKSSSSKKDESASSGSAASASGSAAAAAAGAVGGWIQEM